MGDIDEATLRDVVDVCATTGLLDGPLGLFKRADDEVVTALTALGVFVAGNSFVVVPSTTKAVAPDARQMRLLPLVTQPPGVRICPFTLYVVPELAVYVLPSTVISGGSVAIGCRSVVRPSTTIVTPFGDSEIVCPFAVITPPGTSVWPPMTKPARPMVAA